METLLLQLQAQKQAIGTLIQWMDEHDLQSITIDPSQICMQDGQAIIDVDTLQASVYHQGDNVEATTLICNNEDVLEAIGWLVPVSLVGDNYDADPFVITLKELKKIQITVAS